MVFFFSKLTIATPRTGYAAVVVPTNVANWSESKAVGNVTAVNIGEGQINVYFSRTNPCEELGLTPAADGSLELTSDQRNALHQKLEAIKVLNIPGSTALLGMSLDWIPFEDLNWLTIITEGATADLDVYVQMVEQRLPEVGA